MMRIMRLSEFAVGVFLLVWPYASYAAKVDCAIPSGARVVSATNQRVWGMNYTHTERTARGIGRQSAPIWQQYVARHKVEKFRMVVREDHDDIVSANIASHGSWELTDPAQLAALAHSQLPVHNSTYRPTFLDIGANVGYHTLLFAHAGYDVIAVEPMPGNLELIEASLCLNPALSSRVTLIRSALGTLEQSSQRCVVVEGAASGQVTGRTNIGNGEMRCDEGIATDSTSLVAVRTLDSVLEQLSPRSIDVAKLDIEGHECSAIAGGQLLLTRFRPRFIQFEANDAQSDSCMRNEAQKHGYRIGTRTGLDDNTVMSWDCPGEESRAIQNMGDELQAAQWNIATARRFLPRLLAAVKACPSDGSVLSLTAVVLMQCGKYAQAAELQERHIGILAHQSPEAQSLLVQLATSLIGSGRTFLASSVLRHLPPRLAWSGLKGASVGDIIRLLESVSAQDALVVLGLHGHDMC